MTKQCCDCKRHFEASEFYKNKARPDGLSQRCRGCSRAHTSRSYYRRQKRDPQAFSKNRYYEGIKYRYGITAEEYDALFAKQEGRCAGCGATEADSKKTRLHVDHDHKTGKVRGLLCTRCNQTIGCAKDSPEQLDTLAAYLRLHQT